VIERKPTQRRPKSLRMCALTIAIQACLAVAPALQSANAWAVPAAAQQSNIRALSDKGIYWYERFRFDLAAQSFNKILLIDPSNESALRWQGLIDLARGDVQAAAVWLGRLQIVHGNTPAAIELQQAIALAADKRQQFAELRYLADSENVPADLHLRLQALLPQAPLGEAAVQIYRVMNRTAEGRTQARNQVAELVKRYPDDRRYRTLLTELGGPAAPVIAQTPRAASAQNRPANTRPSTPPRTKPPSTEEPVVVEVAPVPSAPVLSNFEQGQQLSDRAQQAINAGDKTAAANLLQEAIDLNPDYPWFRYDLAVLLDEQGDTDSKAAARKVMDEGMATGDSQEMRFATALLAARQDRGNDALALINAVPREKWTEGMTALEKRVSYGQHLDELRALQRQGDYNTLASAVVAKPALARRA
jgi:tetratricopeptide (TPR) repeat protein